MIVDKACFERGCACYDDRVDGPGVEVVASSPEEFARFIKADMSKMAEVIKSGSFAN